MGAVQQRPSRQQRRVLERKHDAALARALARSRGLVSLPCPAADAFGFTAGDAIVATSRVGAAISVALNFLGAEDLIHAIDAERANHKGHLPIIVSVAGWVSVAWQPLQPLVRGGVS